MRRQLHVALLAFSVSPPEAAPRGPPGERAQGMGEGVGLLLCLVCELGSLGLCTLGDPHERQVDSHGTDNLDDLPDSCPPVEASGQEGEMTAGVVQGTWAMQGLMSPAQVRP